MVIAPLLLTFPMESDQKMLHQSRDWLYLHVNRVKFQELKVLSIGLDQINVGRLFISISKIPG